MSNISPNSKKKTLKHKSMKMINAKPSVPIMLSLELALGFKESSGTAYESPVTFSVLIVSPIFCWLAFWTSICIAKTAAQNPPVPLGITAHTFSNLSTRKRREEDQDIRISGVIFFGCIVSSKPA